MWVYFSKFSQWWWTLGTWANALLFDTVEFLARAADGRERGHDGPYHGGGCADVRWPTLSKEHNFWGLGEVPSLCGNHSIYYSNLRVKHLRYMSVVLCTTQFWRKRFPISKMLQCLNYNTEQDVESSHPGFSNVGSNIPHLPPYE